MRKEKVEKLYVRNGFYHVYNRGNNKQDVFLTEKDYKVFVNLLFKYLKDTSIMLVGYCLMPNHFHMLLKSCSFKAQIPKFMHRFMTSYAMYFNRRYKRVGRVFNLHFRLKDYLKL